ncbi:MAG TPA: hypothetical protein VKA84_02395 [Gemmatimonadaceae bacterium]|nr:hypothetical protein [Gemmatimonadaceae bacterium]
MRTMRSSLPALAAVALSVAVAAAARPAAAQQPTAAPGHARPGVPRGADAGDAEAARTVALYRFATPRRSSGLPALVTVADSAGQLVASFQLPGARGWRPMEVTLIGTDLVLQGETPDGVLTLRLYGQNEPGAAERGLSGRWWLGGQEGELRGRPGR